MSENQRRVLVVEDDAFVAGLLEQSLQAHGFQTMAAQSALEAKQLLGTFEPDVALIDVELGAGPSGVDVMSFIVRMHPETAVIMLTQREALAHGLKLPEAVGFLLKSNITNPEVLIAAIETTVRGQGHLARHEPNTSDLAQLTRTQEDVLRMIALGYSNARIASARGISKSGAEQSVSSVLRALNIVDGDDLNPRVQAARRYIAAKGIPAEL